MDAVSKTPRTTTQLISQKRGNACQCSMCGFLPKVWIRIFWGSKWGGPNLGKLPELLGFNNTEGDFSVKRMILVQDGSLLCKALVTEEAIEASVVKVL